MTARSWSGVTPHTRIGLASGGRPSEGQVVPMAGGQHYGSGLPVPVPVPGSPYRGGNQGTGPVGAPVRNWFREPGTTCASFLILRHGRCDAKQPRALVLCDLPGCEHALDNVEHDLAPVTLSQHEDDLVPGAEFLRLYGAPDLLLELAELRVRLRPLLRLAVG